MSEHVSKESGEQPRSGGLGAVDTSTARLLERVLEYSRAREYAGWDYGDGMSSRVWAAVPVDSKWLNIAFQEVVKRSPVNLRPLFLVEQRRNYMGAALFAMANQNARTVLQALDIDSRVDYGEETRRLLDWLVASDTGGYSGFALGHPHDIQDLQGYAEACTPDSVVTSYAVKALLRGEEFGDRYPAVAETAADFVVEDLEYSECEDGTARITYSENHPDRYYTLNAGAVAGRMFADLYDHFRHERFRRRARKILDYIVAKQRPNGGWLYREPPSASHLSMDNHHNGFILESLLRYQETTGESRYADAVESSLSFHRQTLFDRNGAPNFDEKESYPRDIHATAQGILVFTYTGRLQFARRILDWALENLHAGNGRFYFRKYQYHTKRVTLMRWCQAWMAYAVSEYLRAAVGEGRE